MKFERYGRSRGMTPQYYAFLASQTPESSIFELMTNGDILPLFVCFTDE